MDHILFAPNTGDQGLILEGNEHADLIEALTDFMPDLRTSVEDLYYFSYYELIAEGMILPHASFLNPYLRKVMSEHDEVTLVLLPLLDE